MNTEISWESINSSIIAGVPAIHRRLGEPSVDFVVEPNQGALTLRVPVDDATSLLLPRETKVVTAHYGAVDGSPVIEFRCRDPLRFHDFHAFANVVADRIQSGTAPLDAFEQTLKSWQRLIQAEPRLAEDAEIGLWGELWMLNFMLASMDASVALSCWTGPRGQPHDFTLGALEFEVKTTQRTRREHVIHGLSQLDPSLGKELKLISIQVQPVDDHSGVSLPEAVAKLEAQLASETLVDSFRELLALAHYQSAHAPAYSSRFELRTEVRSFSVTPEFPRLTPAGIEQLLGALAERIDDVQYRIDVTSWPGSVSGIPWVTEVAP